MDVSQNTNDPIKTTDTCLVGCQPPCATTVPRGQILDYHIIAPWVEVKFLDGNGFTLSVGNESFPANDLGLRHSAVIKDFEYGMSNGAGVRFTVHDQLGSPFVTFAERMNKRFKDVSTDYVMKIRFGWVARDCNGGVICTPEMRSREITFLPVSIENSFNDGGKIVYAVEGTDTLWQLGQSRVTKNYGEEGKRKPLKQAIKDMFEGDPEPKMGVNFWRQVRDGQTEEWEFKGNPTSVFHGASKSKLEAALDWMKPYLTDQNRGVYYTWDTSASVPTITFWESPFGANETINPICLKHYVVNGGRCSPVVSFSPRAKMVYSKILNKTGGGAGIGGAKAVKSEGQEGKEEEVGAGVQYYSVSAVRNDVLDVYGLSSETTERAMNAEIEHSRKFFPFSESVSAELVIQGDPTNNFVDVAAWAGKTLSIVVINPFHLLANNATGENTSSPIADCPIWLAAPPCNPVFTSNMWFIQKVHHSIKAGSYLTTISLMLPHPGAEITEEQLNPFDSGNPLLVDQNPNPEE